MSGCIFSMYCCLILVSYLITIAFISFLFPRKGKKMKGKWTARVPLGVGHYWVKIIQARVKGSPLVSIPFPVEIEECGDGDVWMFQLGQEDAVNLTPGTRSSTFRFYTDPLLPPK